MTDGIQSREQIEDRVAQSLVQRYVAEGCWKFRLRQQLRAGRLEPQP